MKFEKGYIYHIYNQGNNRQKIFFNKENYLFFLKKIKTYITPYADIMAWCLMPNHFHLMALVNEVSLPLNALNEGFALSETLGTRTLNQSIGIMLRSYTNAINKQRNTSGSLFRNSTKAECLNCLNGVTPSFYTTLYGTNIKVSNPLEEYPQVCFEYIHNNPVKAGLVENVTDWEYSSARDYAGIRNGTLVNKKIAEKYIDIARASLRAKPSLKYIEIIKRIC
jgi:putative transposase